MSILPFLGCSHPIDRSVMKSFLIAIAATMLLLASFVSLVGCSGKTSDRDLVFIDAGQTRTLLAGKNKLIGGVKQGVAVDPRKQSEYMGGHIPGAINLPLEIARESHEALEGYDAVIVYGEDYNSVLANSMAKILAELGYDVSILRGGVAAWKEAGYELEEGLPGLNAAP